MDNEQVSRMDKRVYALEKRGASFDEGMDAVDTHVYATQGHALDEMKQQALALDAVDDGLASEGARPGKLVHHHHNRKHLHPICECYTFLLFYMQFIAFEYAS